MSTQFPTRTFGEPPSPRRDVSARYTDRYGEHRPLPDHRLGIQPPSPRRGAPARYADRGDDYANNLSSVETLRIELPPGRLGVDIKEAADGTCIVVSRQNEASPLHVGDVLLSLNGREFARYRQSEWTHHIQESSTLPIRHVVIRRERSNGTTQTHTVPREEAAHINERGSTGNDQADEGGNGMHQTTPNNSPKRRSKIRIGNPFNRLSSKNKGMRVYIQPAMIPETYIRVLCPNRSIIPVRVPPRDEWCTDDSNGTSRQYFRVDFDPNQKHCTCVPSMGVFDSECPACRGGGGGNNGSKPERDSSYQAFLRWLYNRDRASAGRREASGGEPPGGELDDVISIAQEEDEGGSVAPAQASFAENLGWQCMSCTLINPIENDACDACRTKRHGGGLREDEMLPATLHLR